MTQYSRKSFYSTNKNSYRLAPVDAFLENHLKENHKKGKNQAGIFFTPLPVVHFMVRSLDILLRQYYPFLIKTGLADQHSIIIDPAAGTSTFAIEVIRYLLAHYTRGSGVELETTLLKQFLENNLFTFEICEKLYLAGYTRILSVLNEIGVNLKNPAACNFYHLNALDLPKEIMEKMTGKENQVLSVIGNPPYSTYPPNRTSFIGKLLELYKQDVKDEKNLQPLSKDYIRFIRLVHWLIEQKGRGIAAFVVNNSFLSGLIHRGMRKQLLKTFDFLYILNLHGNPLCREKTPAGKNDVNVFNIRPGVAIIFFLKTEGNNGHGDQPITDSLGKVFYYDVWGSKENKFDFLGHNDVSSIDWKELKPVHPYFFLEKKDFSNETSYNGFPAIPEIFNLRSSCVQTHRDQWVIGFTRDELKEKLEQLPGNLRQKLIGVNLDEAIITYHHRPFDLRYICYLPEVIERDRRAVMQHFLSENIGLCVMRQYLYEAAGGYNYVFCVDQIADARIFNSTRGTAFVLPLYTYLPPQNEIPGDRSRPVRKVSNIDPRFLGRIKNLCGSGRIESDAIISLNIFYYIYAVLHSTFYRGKYEEFLKIDFPRIPFPLDVELFERMVQVGKNLVELHLLKSKEPEQTLDLEGGGDNIVEVIKYAPQEKRGYINKRQYFSDIDQSIWEYHIGGYPVIQKWLKAREGRRLSVEDIGHFSRVSGTLAATIGYQKEIDGLYPHIERNMFPDSRSSGHWGSDKM